MTGEPTVLCGLEQTRSVPGSRAFTFTPEAMDCHPVITHVPLPCLGRGPYTGDDQAAMVGGGANSTLVDTCLWHIMGVRWLSESPTRATVVSASKRRALLSNLAGA